MFAGCFSRQAGYICIKIFCHDAKGELMNSYFLDYHGVFSEENNNLLKLLSLDICYYAKGV